VSLGQNTKIQNRKGKMKGLRKNGEGGVGVLRGVAWCGDDNRIITTCSCMPSQGVITKKNCTKNGYSEYIVIKINARMCRKANKNIFNQSINKI
jgi:hypothetical protein